MLVASRKCSICAPLIWGSTMAFQRRKFVLVSFSDGGDPRELAPLLEEEAWEEPANWVVRAPVVDVLRVEKVEAEAVDASVPAMASIDGG